MHRRPEAERGGAAQTAFVLAEVFDEVGLPPESSPGDRLGPVVGEAIAAHPDVDMCRSPSTPRRKRVSEVASATVKRVALELGGSRPTSFLSGAI